MVARDELRGRQELLREAAAGRLSRRDIIKRGAALGLSAPALATVLAAGPKLAGAQDSVTITSWAPAGQRWEFPQQAVYEHFQEQFPNIAVEWIAEPIGDMLPKTAVAMAAREDRYDIIHEDYNFVPQLIAMEALEPLEPYLDQDPDFKEDILADVPENVMDLYRDRPASEGGVLYGLPPDSNTQLQYYRMDVLEEAGIDGPATTWDEALEIARELSGNGERRVTGTTLRRGLWAGGVFITLLRSYGGDWFDSQEEGHWNPTLNTEEGFAALDMLVKLTEFMEPGALNAVDDEANTAMLAGSWHYAPVQWGGTVMNDPEFTEFSEVWGSTVVPMGTGPNARHAPHMGGLGLVIPAFSHHKDEAWEFVKFCNYGDAQDPEVAEAWVEGTGQPARLSLLEKYADRRAHFPALMESLPVSMRYLPIPESNALYESVGAEVAAVVTGSKDIEAALEDMDEVARRIMGDAGYYDD